MTIDTCILPDHCVTDVYNGDLGESRLMACQGGEDPVPFGGYRYAGLVTQMLTQISAWMEDNRNEVIGLQFTHNSPQSNKSAVVKEVIRLLEQRWCPDGDVSEGPCSNSTDNLRLSTYYNQSGAWPTLAQAIDTNSRIFVSIDEALNVDNLERKWMNPPPISKYSFLQPSSTSTSCAGLIDCAEQCNSTTELLSATGYMLGLCNTNVQQDCNMRLADYIEECHGMRQQHDKTINVILVNYPELGDAVFEAASLVNERNLARYIPSATTVQPNTTSATTDFTTAKSMRGVVSNISLILTIIMFNVLIITF